MDFASLMSKEIAKAKGGTLSTNTTATKTSSSDTSDTTKATAAPPKFISRREAEEQRRAAYLAEQKAIEEARTAKVAAKRKREEEAAEEARAREEKRQRLAEESRARREAKAAEEERARRKRLGLPELPPQGADDKNTKTDQDDDLDGDDSDDVEIPDDDGVLRRKLRELGEPSVLFGETLPARKRRYRTIVRGEAAANVPIPTTLRPVDEKDMKVPDKLPPTSDKKAQRYLFRQLSSYFNMVLREWEAALARENNADTTVGQQAIHAMVSSKETMKPLFRMFEKGDIDDTILKAIVEIVKAAQERRYVDANDGYLRLSIGKAAWPIGVTMVGIHERSAREKLHNGERGHIMGSETTRKFLQSIKRCLTFAQVRWPPDDIRQLMG